MYDVAGFGSDGPKWHKGFVLFFICSYFHVTNVRTTY